MITPTQVKDLLLRWEQTMFPGKTVEYSTYTELGIDGRDQVALRLLVHDTEYMIGLLLVEEQNNA